MPHKDKRKRSRWNTGGVKGQIKRSKGPKRKKGNAGKEPAVHAKNQYHTYPRCPIKIEDALQHFMELGTAIDASVVKYFIAQEQHKVPGLINPDTGVAAPQEHLHCYVGWDKKAYCRFSSLTLVQGDTKYPGNYQACRSVSQVLGYCAKDGNYITNIPEDELKQHFAKAARAKVSFSDVVKQAKSGNLTEAYENLLAIAPRDAIMRGPNQVRANLAELDSTKQPAVDKGWQFNEPESLKAWDREKQTLVMVGGSGYGKTQLCKHLFGGRVFIAKDLNQLRGFNPDKYEAILLDDVTFVTRSDEFCVHFVDLEEQTGINVKYGTALIPAGYPRMITRVRFPFRLPLHTEIRRRIHVVAVTEDLRILSEEQKQEAVKPADDLDAVLEMADDVAAEASMADFLAQDSSGA